MSQLECVPSTQNTLYMCVEVLEEEYLYKCIGQLKLIDIVIQSTSICTT